MHDSRVKKGQNATGKLYAMNGYNIFRYVAALTLVNVPCLWRTVIVLLFINRRW